MTVRENTDDRENGARAAIAETERLIASERLVTLDDEDRAVLRDAAERLEKLEDDDTEPMGTCAKLAGRLCGLYGRAESPGLDPFDANLDPEVVQLVHLCIGGRVLRQVRRRPGTRGRPGRVAVAQSDRARGGQVVRSGGRGRPRSLVERRRLRLVGGALSFELHGYGPAADDVAGVLATIAAEVECGEC